jgi:hypothetical protein
VTFAKIMDLPQLCKLGLRQRPYFLPDNSQIRTLKMLCLVRVDLFESLFALAVADRSGCAISPLPDVF